MMKTVLLLRNYRYMGNDYTKGDVIEVNTEYFELLTSKGIVQLFINRT